MQTSETCFYMPKLEAGKLKLSFSSKTHTLALNIRLLGSTLQGKSRTGPNSSNLLKVKGT